MTAPRCAACKRRLSDPASIAAGLGSHCRRKLAPAAPTPGRSDAPRAGAVSECSSWSPVDGCQCAALLGHVPHPTTTTEKG